MIRLGIIGTSSIAHAYATAAKASGQFEIKAVYSRNQFTARSFGEGYGADIFVTTLKNSLPWRKSMPSTSHHRTASISSKPCRPSPTASISSLSKSRSSRIQKNGKLPSRLLKPIMSSCLKPLAICMSQTSSWSGMKSPSSPKSMNAAPARRRKASPFR